MNSTSGLLSLAPGEWRGDDGNWSTFSVLVDGASGPFYVLPATGGSQIWLPNPIMACQGSTIPDCNGERGIPNYTSLDKASGWTQYGTSNMSATPPIFEIDRASFWFGSVGWNSVNSGDIETPDNRTTIASYTDREYWLGLVGLGNDPTRFDMQTMLSSPLQALKDAGHIGSLSYGYTAGAAYLDEEAGSLTLGGYDEARFQSDNVVNVTMKDAGRKLQLQMTDISVSGGIQGGIKTLLTPEELPEGLSVLLDSSTAQLWLPADVCQQFAEAFGLTYQEPLNLYTIDQTSRGTLHDHKANLSFTIGAGSTLETSTTIVLPFRAYDLTLFPPLAETSAGASYFPLRNATAESGNILGRVFLQEAYVVVDWERSVFNVSRTTHAVQSPRLVPIASIDSTSSDTTGNKSLTRGGQAGIVVSCLILLFAIVAVLWWFRRRRSRERDRKALTIGTVETIETGWEKPELMAKESKSGQFLELDFLRGGEADSTQLLEMSGSEVERELMSTEVLEMEGDLVQQDVKKSVGGDKEANDKEEKKVGSVHELEARQFCERDIWASVNALAELCE
ncbi:hypothetical protein M409DRAFT_16064 [Zasmidium cellare ATCC 36951]|uniref:Peptidase A1 domain-containing protein n=1 Tax=Zasmidium cellare ATCC 36951 TaxID=1080233 RepID=A0A6A6D3V3_ZASCE|nr:uncharacterized protein M409DRAFT_16064 [Zasmidium cellare ATCC 36951]KAF2173793.1 hypothetical protein M409DRAFT_16064 [Zasmidium cellare ATCC 36951]